MNVCLKQGDCLQLMKQLQDKSVDMILCDLPYGVTAHKEDIIIPFDELWKQYKRIIKDNGAIVLFAQGTFYVDLVMSNKQMFRYDLVWDKVLTTGFLNANKMPLRQHEQIAVFYKKEPTYNKQYSYGIPLHAKSKHYTGKTSCVNNYSKFVYSADVRAGSTEKFPTSILTFSKPAPSVSNHRTQKPVDLLKYLIRTYTNKGDTVLDNCMGSGTTGIACVNTDRNFIGYELNKDYFDFAKKTIEREMNRLF